VYELPLSGHYFLIKRGEQLIRSRSLWDEDIAMPELGGAVERVQRGDGPAGQALLVFAARFPDAGGGLPVTLVVAEDVTTIDAAIADFRLKTFIALALALGLLLILQRRVLVQGLAPLDEAVAACRRLERGEVVPIDATAPAEVQPMLDAVSRLAHHHTQRLTRIRHAVGNLSHALKTPLAVLAQDADEIGRRGDPALAARLRPARQHARDDGARAAPGAAVGRRPGGVELRGARPAGGARRCAAAAARRAPHRIELDAPDTALPVDREDMLELFGNLLDNACKWARGRVRVQVEPAGAGGQLAFSVEDDGPGCRGAARPARHGRPAHRREPARPWPGAGDRQRHRCPVRRHAPLRPLGGPGWPAGGGEPAGGGLRRTP
jgi:signal transduction histidine kinase